MTQGLVSVIKNGVVIFKIVAGCSGYNGPALSRRLGRNLPINIQKCIAYAKEEGFGCIDCLVVMDASCVTTNAKEVDELYRETFHDPRFNPRWKQGTADYICIVDMDGKHQELPE